MKQRPLCGAANYSELIHRITTRGDGDFYVTTSGDFYVGIHNGECPGSLGFASIA